MSCIHCGCALFEDEQGNYLHLWSGWHNCDPYQGGPLYAEPDHRPVRTIRLPRTVL